MTTETAPPTDRATYLRTRKLASVQLYFPTLAVKTRYMAMAGEQHFPSFNQFLLHMLSQATSGNVYPAGYVPGLEKEIEKLRGWVRQKDDQLHELQQERATLLRQVADLRLVAQTVATPGVRA
ncbi:MAG: hypothetical protein QOE90_815 [Thermoplasmata archaeon]|jgi:hypothetical protein|nr:hypothetical protein [Thermoplasmata archaeon]